ncbi:MULTISPECIES: LysE/ArgO family amino acid transporter [unclassified Photobacterium]|uniref:LysE/ArgO family amino acid transporter n=1 Tax=unclassified Photobacterium TaxID=2628852 RepID=UPI000D1642B3|nr:MULTISPECIES: LysE/ArgO family amino acid transporter [unclassified Photobacterium]PSV44612.1 amino acid transporter [Photobacterium sp. GB-36]PSV53753.1 amino acid transporter [Photobacterium sp. GB-1]
MTIFLAGFSLGLSLILAIGSQNAFVLKQGLKNQYVFIICIVCALSDALLISFGVAGFGVIVSKYPDIETVARYGGAIFLTVYGLLSFKSALMTDHALLIDQRTSGSLLKTILTCLAFTWLNPHVYLDTVVLLGSISTQYQPYEWQFALGAITASFVFFFSLGYGSRLLAPLFQQPKAWKVLEILVGVIMLSIAASLALGI